MRVRIGTRGSALARTQAATVASALAAQGHATTLVIIRTAGDDSPAPSFGSIGPQGVFVREIEQALLDGRVDVAVHSCKDLPTASPDGLVIGAVPPRVDPADVLIAKPAAHEPTAGVIPLATGATVGTASARRQSWIRHLRPDLAVKSVRGNVPTRVGKLAGDYDAILLAAAGLERLEHAAIADRPRLGLDKLAVTRLHPRMFVPAPAQGALALQCRRDDAGAIAALAALDDAVSHACIAAERSLLARVEGGCELALGAYCTQEGQHYELVAMLERDGEIVSASETGEDPAALVERIWEAWQRR